MVGLARIYRVSPVGKLLHPLHAGEYGGLGNRLQWGVHHLRAITIIIVIIIKKNNNNNKNNIKMIIKILTINNNNDNNNKKLKGMNKILHTCMCKKIKI